jgi:hypothetical protein
MMNHHIKQPVLHMQSTNVPAGWLHRHSSSFPELTFPAKLSNIRYTSSEPALNKLNSSRAISLSLSQNLNAETLESDGRVHNSTTAPAYFKPATAKTSVHKPVAPLYSHWKLVFLKSW